MSRIYLDHNATTPLHPDVADEVCRCLRMDFGSASALYSCGREARELIEDARGRISSVIGAGKDEIIFTSGGAEANSLAIRGAAYANIDKGRHIIISSIEHRSVLDTCEALEKEGFDVTYIPVDGNGLVRLNELMKAIRPDTVLVSIMHANDEVGTVQLISEIGSIARERGVLFHTDAVQTFGKVRIDVREMNIDLLSASAHKFHGPKGIGALYVRKGVKISPIKCGGTENVPAIAGFGKAVEIAVREMEGAWKKVESLRDRLWDEIKVRIPNVRMNGHPIARLKNTLSVSFEIAESKSLILSLDEFAICVGSGSACISDPQEPSHVLLAMGLSPEVAQCTLRFSLGRGNTVDEIDFVIDTLPKVVERVRSMSPYYKGFLKR